MAKFCNNCGKQIEENSKFCDSCGKEVLQKLIPQTNEEVLEEEARRQELREFEKFKRSPQGHLALDLEDFRKIKTMVTTAK